MVGVVGANLTQFAGLVFSRHTVTSGLTSATIMGAGDVVCQSVQREVAKGEKHDWFRTFKFFLVGLTFHGPYTFYCLKALDQQFGTALNFKNALRKAFVGHLTIHPTYVAGMYMYMGLLEGQDFQGCVDRVANGFVPTVAVGTMFWPIANLIIYRYVPFNYRLTYSNLFGLVWNTFLSWQASQVSQQQQQSIQKQQLCKQLKLKQ
eukprot:TRINITY_DN9887_c0_g1_i4.p4 TRINITY_DN9887_c0_g1~~TRINITY_DN9887_c0_g1_i4.p4  ORF type:complete len:205 (+),score=14.52 TRINITY_DN9887_c0_g1_i4:191-805(+)